MLILPPLMRPTPIRRFVIWSVLMSGALGLAQETATTDNAVSNEIEDFSVKLREPIHVAGIAKVTEAGLEAHFQMLDPASAPQPV